jgi:hypothetical protein
MKNIWELCHIWFSQNTKHVICKALDFHQILQYTEHSKKYILKTATWQSWKSPEQNNGWQLCECATLVSHKANASLVIPARRGVLHSVLIGYSEENYKEITTSEVWVFKNPPRYYFVTRNQRSKGTQETLNRCCQWLSYHYDHVARL